MPESFRTWLLLHGTPLTPTVWDGVAEALRAHGNVVTPAISHGREQDGGQAWHARRVLAEVAGSVPLDVVGHSFGGQVALEMALLAPQRVRSLTIVCSRHTPFPAFADAAAALRRGDPVDADTTLSRWFTPSELEAAETVVGYARDCLESVDRRSWADDLDHIAGFDRSAEVSSLTMPVHLIAADQDHVATVAVMAELADQVAHATLHVLDNASHMSPFVDPKRLTALLLAAPVTSNP